MKYSENFKKSQTKKVPSGYQMEIDCREVVNVTDENGELLKFFYDKKAKMLSVLESKFNLITVEYNS